MREREEETRDIGCQGGRKKDSLTHPDHTLPLRTMWRKAQGEIADLLVETTRLDGLPDDLEPSPLADDVGVDPNLADGGLQELRRLEMALDASNTGQIDK